MHVRKGLKPSGALAGLILVTVAFLAPAQSPAVIQSGCGGTTFAGGFYSCTFAPAGVAYELSAEASDGVSFVQVYVTDALNNYLAYCNGYGSCFAYARPLSLGAYVGHPLPDAGPWRCHFQSGSGGVYSCKNQTA